MKIAFVGKGGSGKTTVSSLYTKYLANNGNNVLAIDVDHNMDFMLNLGMPELPTYLGEAMPDILSYCKLPDSAGYRDALKKNAKDIKFSINPQDEFTSKYSHRIRPNLHIMSAGPHNDKILKEGYCSHSLGTPLKIYLPFLELADKEFVVLDEKAGADGVGTGIAKGLDLVIVVVEPTRYALKAASQITTILEEFGVPYEYVANKVFGPEDIKLVEETLGKSPIASFNIDRTMAALSEHKSSDLPQSESLDKIHEQVTSIKNKLKVK